jgi:hypothetical protein
MSKNVNIYIIHVNSHPSTPNSVDFDLAHQEARHLSLTT